MSLAGAAVIVENELWGIASAAHQRVARRSDSRGTRQDRFVWLIVVAVAVVIVLGLMAAWFIYCQSRGGWPALDMPGWSSGGTWKLYCAK